MYSTVNPVDAQKIIDPVVKLHRELAARNHGDVQQHVELARTLYAEALIDRAHRHALLHEAQTLFEALPPQLRALRSVQLWQDMTRKALSAAD